MEMFAGMYSIIIIVIFCFAVGSFLALPMIWYHIGFVSRKLDKIIKLLENNVCQKKDL